MSNYKIKGKKRENPLKITTQKLSYNNLKPKWAFDLVDSDGKFAFDISRKEFNKALFLEKLISYSTMTWDEIMKQTHDDNKSKNHFLKYDGLSKEVKKRIDKKKLNERTDIIFSLALNNKTRIVGIKENDVFHIIWYDAYHEIYPSKKK